MKSRRLIIGIVVLAVAGAAAFAGIAITEKRVETSVREALDSVGASYGAVRYRLLGDELTLEDVAHTMTLLGMETRTEIRSIVVNGPDQKALDPAAPGRPLVAERITVRGIVQKAVSQDPAFPGNATSTEELVIEDWHQNLGRVFEEYAKAPLSEPFFEALLDYSVGRVFYTNCQGESAQNGIFVRFNIGRVTVSDMRDACLSYLVEDIAFSGSLQGGVHRAGITRLRLPPAQMLAKTVDMARQMSNDPPEIVSEAMGTLMASHIFEYIRATPYEKLWLEDMNFSIQPPGHPKPVQLFSLKRFENGLNFGNPGHFDLLFKELLVPRDIVELALDNGMSDLGVRDFVLDELRLGVTAEAGASVLVNSLTLDAALRDFGSVSGQLACQIVDWPPKGLGPFMENAEAWGKAIAPRTKIEKVKVSFTDSGLLRRVLENFAEGSGMTPEALLPILREEAAAAARAVPVPGLQNAVAVMLDKPGTLTVEMTPAAPMPMREVVGRAMLDPASLGLRASATAGSASLLEALPAGK